MNKTVKVKLLDKDDLLIYTGEDVISKENLERQINTTFMGSEFINLGALIVRRSEIEWISIDDIQIKQ